MLKCAIPRYHAKVRELVSCIRKMRKTDRLYSFVLYLVERSPTISKILFSILYTSNEEKRPVIQFRFVFGRV